MKKWHTALCNGIRFLENCAAWILNNRKIYFKDLFNEWINFRYETVPANKISNEERILLYLTLMNSKKNIKDLINWIKFIYVKLNIKDTIVSSSRHIDDANDLKDFVKFIRENKEKMDIKKFSNLGVQGNTVSLLTMHSSKGGEYEMDEEKRIFFISLTRAKSVCYFLMSKSLFGYSKKASRFIEHIDFTSIIDE